MFRVFQTRDLNRKLVKSAIIQWVFCPMGCLVLFVTFSNIYFFYIQEKQNDSDDEKQEEGMKPDVS